MDQIPLPDCAGRAWKLKMVFVSLNGWKNEGMEPKQKQYPVVHVTGDRSKVQYCKEQYCIGTWNVRSMTQGKLEVVKQEMARVNIDILGISEQKWTGMDKYNSDECYIYYSGKESLRGSNCQHPLDHGKSKSSRKTSISALLTMPEPLTVWITINCGKFWKRWEYQTTWPASWEIYMQVKKQQLELGMEQ